MNFHKIFLIAVYKVFMKQFLRLFMGVQFSDSSHLKDVDQFVLVANHNSHLDTMILLSSLPWQIIDKVHPVAAGDYFARNRVMGFFTKLFVNTVFVYRVQAGPGANIQSLDNYLKEGKSLILFPEGTRGAPDEMVRFKSGIGVLLEKNDHVPFIAAYIDGVGRAMPKGDGLPVPFVIKFRLGKTVSVKGESVEEINAKIYANVLSLKEQK